MRTYSGTGTAEDWIYAEYQYFYGISYRLVGISLCMQFLASRVGLYRTAYYRGNNNNNNNNNSVFIQVDKPQPQQ